MPLAAVPYHVGLLGFWYSNVDVGVVVILSLVANTMYWLVRWGLVSAHSIKSSSALPPPPTRHLWQLVLLFVVIQLGVALFGYIRKHHQSIVFLSLVPAVFMTLILLLFIVSLERRTTQNESFLSLFLPVLPFLVAGKCYMIAWSIWMEFESMVDLQYFLWRVVVPVYLRIIFVASTTKRQRQERSFLSEFLHSTATFVFAHYVLEVGGGYVVGHFVACLAWIDIFLFCVSLL
jgi:hypothetical protein